MKLLYGHSAEVAAWVGWRIPVIKRHLERDPASEPFGPAQAIGVLDNQNQLVAGVVFHNWNPDFQTVELSFAADTAKWLNRTVIQAMMTYAFDTLGCCRINATTPKTARDARRFIQKFGFRREGVATDGFGPGQDVIISRLLKREWLQTKWVKPPTAPH
jgi:RimJ/RimL family protein N-acetyltransferase